MDNYRNKIKWLIPMEELEQEAQSQIFKAAENDFCISEVVLPDAHSGYLFAVGSVVLLDSVISPKGVGTDIGCGMCAIITDINIKELGNARHREYIYNEIKRRIPMGINSHENTQNYDIKFKSALDDKNFQTSIDAKFYKQLGTLGGGNHFIEIGCDQNNNIAIILHSGSRNSGKQIYDRYDSLSNINDKHVPNGYLDLNSDLGKSYKHDLDIMLQYALLNRKIMMENILDILNIDKSYMKTLINENHNHAIVLENNYVLHRKGATPADKNQLGIIPGNMKDGTYFTIGLGNEEYLSSASHGAGRKGSRSWAKNKFTLDYFEKEMKGITATVCKGTLDECPGAYKDINIVIERQKGIVVDIVNYSKPIINIKDASDRKKNKKNE